MLVKRKLVYYWMLLGLLMIFLQMIIGGVTRLTGSGLSITKWEIVTGTVPPFSEGEWQAEFDLYKKTPQYKKINAGMTLSQFKVIYFWEYLHRLWARLMGFVFVFPFIFFIRRRWIAGSIVNKLWVVFGLAALVAAFGWIMVVSGLSIRPWVSAYRLSFHLLLALALYAYLLWTTLEVGYPGYLSGSRIRKVVGWYLALLVMQMFLGGMMSGLKAALLYPTWPAIGDEFIPSIIIDATSWTVGNFVNYDQGPFLSSLVHFLHRTLGYILFMVGIWLFLRIRRINDRTTMVWISWLFICVLIIQVILGISVLLESVGVIPVLLGVLHQAFAIFLLTMVILVYYFVSFNREESVKSD